MTLLLDADLISDESHIVLDGVSWETYESIVRDFDKTGQRKRVTYDDGRMIIVSPLPKHEKWKTLIGLMVAAMAEGADFPLSTFGSTTWRRKQKKKGLEPDECFYIQHEPQVRGRMNISLKTDPPPDLAVEVDLRPYLMHKLNVYAGLKIPEVWCFDGIEMEMYVLGTDGEYEKVEASAAIPFLTPTDLKRFLDQYTKTDQTSLIRSVRAWAKKAAK